MPTSSPIRGRTLFVVAVAASFAVAPPPPLRSQPRQRPQRHVIVDGREAVAHEVLVRFRQSGDAATHAQVEADVDADEDEQIGTDEVHRYHSRSLRTEDLVAFLRFHPEVEYAEPNYVVHALATPSDPKFPHLWGLHNVAQNVNGGGVGLAGADIHALSAWKISTGSRANVVAVVDSGIDYTHPDLSANVWSAPAAFTVTIGGVSVRCAAGTHGFNVITKTCYPTDDDDHGTHVSGTIGARGNNGVGVVGVNWTASLMGAKFLDATGTGTVADAINAIEFAIQAKASFRATSGANVRVLSNSWSGGGFSQALLDEIKKANTNNMLFVAAAGNDGTDNDVTPTYPANYAAPNVISVAASDNQDQLASFSNYGSSVQLAAPGVNIQSTIPASTYQYLSGTSMATPHVSGAAALLLSKCSLDTASLRRTLLANVDALGSLRGWVKTGGRLNVDRALRACIAASITSPTPGVAPKPPTDLKAASGPDVGDITLSWTASTGATGYAVKRSLYLTGPFSTVQKLGVATKYVNKWLESGRKYYYVVTASNANGQSAVSNVAGAAAR